MTGPLWYAVFARKGVEDWEWIAGVVSDKEASDALAHAKEKGFYTEYRVMCTLLAESTDGVPYLALAREEPLTPKKLVDFVNKVTARSPIPRSEVDLWQEDIAKQILDFVRRGGTS